MFKVFSLLRRPDGWSRERFQRWWLQEHVPYAKRLPGLRRYNVALVTRSTTHSGREPFDGLAELWFDSREALEAAWGSEAGKTAVQHSQANVGERMVLLTEVHEIIK